MTADKSGVRFQVLMTVEREIIVLKEHLRESVNSTFLQNFGVYQPN